MFTLRIMSDHKQSHICSERQLPPNGMVSLEKVFNFKKQSSLQNFGVLIFQIKDYEQCLDCLKIQVSSVCQECHAQTHIQHDTFLCKPFLASCCITLLALEFISYFFAPSLDFRPECLHQEGTEARLTLWVFSLQGLCLMVPICMTSTEQTTQNSPQLTTRHDPKRKQMKKEKVNFQEKKFCFVLVFRKGCNARQI